LKKHLLLISLLLFLGCENQLEEYQPEPNIFCPLRTDKDTTIALVGMSIGLSDSLKNPEQWNGISGASVKIDYGNGEVRLRELKDSVGFYMTDSLKIVSGKTYNLKVIYPDGKIVKGKTTVPDSFSIIDIISIDTVIDTLNVEPIYIENRINIVITWDRSQNAKGYSIIGEGFYRSENDSTCWGLQYNSDSNIDSIWFPTVSFTWDSLMNIDTLNLIEVAIKIWALDENYYDYHKLRGEWWSYIGNDPTPYIHLDGGFGVFGSAYVCQERRIALSR
jgi:hypothetical protein